MVKRFLFTFSILTILLFILNCESYAQNRFNIVPSYSIKSFSESERKPVAIFFYDGNVASDVSTDRKHVVDFFSRYFTCIKRNMNGAVDYETRAYYSKAQNRAMPFVLLLDSGKVIHEMQMHSIRYNLPVITRDILEKVNCQAVVRNQSGLILRYSDQVIRLTVRNGTAGAILYQERHHLTTDDDGLFNAVLGDGDSIVGSYKSINWLSAQNHIEAELLMYDKYFSLGEIEKIEVPEKLVNSSYASISGFVRDFNGIPLQSANVVIDASRGLACIADQEGKFLLPSLIPGEYDVSFRYLGLKPLVKRVKLSPGQKLELSVVLLSESQSLADSKTDIASVKQGSPTTPMALPLISITNNAITFADANNNNALDAFERCKLKFTVKNTGKGDGLGLKVLLSAKGSTTGVAFSSSTTLPVVRPGDTYQAEVPVDMGENTTNGSVVFSVKVDEPNGLGSDMIEIEIPTKEFASPLVKVVDYSVTGESGNNLARRQPFNLQVLIQNAKAGTAESVKATLKLPQNVLLISGDLQTDIGTLKGGATKDISYSLIVTDKYEPVTIPITLQLHEKYGKYAQDKTITLTLNQTLSANKITVTALAGSNEVVAINEASLSSDVDKNIPVNPTVNEHRYALVIGNEDYTSFQQGLGTESNVAFASVDAAIFALYCEKTLGVKKENIYLMQNAISTRIKKKLEELCKLIQYEDGNAEVIVYYAGHGFPDEVTKESYLMPVDVAGNNFTEGIKLSDLYRKLTQYPAKRVTVFLDACFSGGGRDAGLLAARGVKVVPKENAIDGNLAVFSASSGDQSSLPYPARQHGMFTYFLLKKLQDTRGDILYKDLFDYVKQNVAIHSIKVNGKDQNPQLNLSSTVGDAWLGWKLK